MFIRNLFLFLFLSSCAFGPEYKRPETVKEPPQYREGKIEWKEAKPNANVERGEWWKIYNDSFLNDLEDKLNKNNQDIISARHAYKASLALISQARASYLPLATGSADITKEQTEQTNNANNKSSTNTQVKKSHSLGFNTSWELDLWGSISYNLKYNIAGAEANNANLGDVKLSMQASLAQYYFELKSLDKDQNLLDEISLANKKLLDYTKNRHKIGITTNIDVKNAENNLQTAQANAMNNKATRAKYQHAIASLLGESPSSFEIKPFKKNDDIDISIPVAIPSDLLERRPDIIKAEKLVEQANAKIGSAIAAFFPSFSLGANATLSGSGLGNLLSMPNLTWSLGPQVSLALFDGGALFAEKKYSEESYQQTVASYKQTVISAFAEVEDQLALLESLNVQTELQKKNVLNTKQILKHTLDQYNSGIIDSSNLLNAEINFNNADKTYSDIIAQKRTAEINLIKALGGGWKK